MLKWIKNLFTPKLKYYKVEYLVSCGWGVMGNDFYCAAYSPRGAHKKYLDAIPINQQYGHPSILKSFSRKREDIVEISFERFRQGKVNEL